MRFVRRTRASCPRPRQEPVLRKLRTQSYLRPKSLYPVLYIPNHFEVRGKAYKRQTTHTQTRRYEMYSQASTHAHTHKAIHEMHSQARTKARNATQCNASCTHPVAGAEVAERTPHSKRVPVKPSACRRLVHITVRLHLTTVPKQGDYS